MDKPREMAGFEPASPKNSDETVNRGLSKTGNSRRVAKRCRPGAAACITVAQFRPFSFALSP